MLIATPNKLPHGTAKRSLCAFYFSKEDRAWLVNKHLVGCKVISASSRGYCEKIKRDEDLHCKAGRNYLLKEKSMPELVEIVTEGVHNV